jgi:hypothetical protein
MKATKTIRGWEVSNHRSRKDKESKSSIDSAAHYQIFKQQKQLNGRSHYTLIDINTECQWTQLPHKKTPFGKLSNNLLFTVDLSY